MLKCLARPQPCPSLVLAWCGAPAGMKTTSPRNCTIAQPWTPYSWWRRFLSDRSKYQLWSWMGSWSTGFSWPCSSATWEVTRQQVLQQTGLTGQSRCSCGSICTPARVIRTVKSYTIKGLDSYSVLGFLVKGSFPSPSRFTDILQRWIWEMQASQIYSKNKQQG